MVANVNNDTSRASRRGVQLAASALIIVPLLILWMLLATNDDDNIALVGNTLSVEGDQRVWSGRVGNVTDSEYRKILIELRFLDGEGAPVHSLSASHARLMPHESFSLQTELPADAVSVRVWSLEWETGRSNKRTDPPLGPWAPWPFGYVQAELPE